MAIVALGALRGGPEAVEVPPLPPLAREVPPLLSRPYLPALPLPLLVPLSRCLCQYLSQCLYQCLYRYLYYRRYRYLCHRYKTVAAAGCQGVNKVLVEEVQRSVERAG